VQSLELDASCPLGPGLFKGRLGHRLGSLLPRAEAVLAEFSGSYGNSVARILWMAAEEGCAEEAISWLERYAASREIQSAQTALLIARLENHLFGQDAAAMRRGVISSDSRDRARRRSLAYLAM
jgi:hypothetical protein